MYGNLIDGIKIAYENGKGNYHGGNGGKPVVL